MVVMCRYCIGYSNFLIPNRNSSPAEPVQPKQTSITQEQLDEFIAKGEWEEQQRIDKLAEDAARDIQYDEFVEQFYEENGYYP